MKITVKNAVCPSLPFAACGVFDCEFGFHSHEWSCSWSRVVSTAPVPQPYENVLDLRRDYAMTPPNNVLLQLAQATLVLATHNGDHAAVSACQTVGALEDDQVSTGHGFRGLAHRCVCAHGLGYLWILAYIGVS